MSLGRRWLGLAGLALLTGLLTALRHGELGRVWAGARSLSARPAQFLRPSPEPPLAASAAAAPPAAAGRPEGGCPVDPPTPVVAIRVRVLSSAAAGQELEYHICVENRSQAPAHHVIVRNPLPANARYVRAEPQPSAREPELVWQLGTLNACACREIVLVLSPTGTGDVKDCARVQFEHGQCVCTKITRPAISLRKRGPTEALLYDVLNYQLTVTNTGSAEVTGIVLTDTLAAGLEHASGKNQLTWDIGNLAPGQCRTFEYQVVAKATGRLCNHAVASAGGLRQEADNCVTITEAKLGLTKTGPARHYANLPATYQITVSNTGTAPLANVTVTDPVPAQMTFVRTTRGGQLTANQVHWTLGTLEPGASRTVAVVLRAQSAGRICNRATVTADRGLSAQAEACTEFVGESGLLLEVVDTVDPVQVGGETSYIILVRNQGTAPATHIRITATVPAQEAAFHAKGPTDSHKDGQKIVFDPLTLQPKKDVRYQVDVKALKPGYTRFHVEMTADQLTSGLPVIEEESTFIYEENPSTGLPPASAPRQNQVRAGR